MIKPGTPGKEILGRHTVGMIKRTTVDVEDDPVQACFIRSEVI